MINIDNGGCFKAEIFDCLLRSTSIQSNIFSCTFFVGAWCLKYSCEVFLFSWNINFKKLKCNKMVLMKCILMRFLYSYFIGRVLEHSLGSCMRSSTSVILLLFSLGSNMFFYIYFIQLQLPSSKYRYSKWSELDDTEITANMLRCPRIRKGDINF